MPDVDDIAGREVYVGDGLFCLFDGFAMTLRASREGGDHWVVLEPLVLKAFIEYAQQCGMIGRQQ